MPQKSLPKVKRTKAPYNYIAPNKGDMEPIAKKIKLKRYNESLIHDMANIAAGGEILPPSEYAGAIEIIAEQTLPGPDSDGEWSTPEGYTKNKNEAIQHHTLNIQKYHDNVTDFLQNIEFNNVPGASPVEKSMMLLKLMQEQNGETSSTIEQDGQDGLPLNQSGQQSANQMNQTLDEITTLDDIDEELLGLKQEMDQMEEPKKGEPSKRTLMQMRLAQDMANGKAIWLKVSRKLEDISRMSVARLKKFEPDVHGQDVRSRPIENFNEIGKINPMEYSLPDTYQLMRVITRAAHIRERGIHTEKQQLLYIIIDSSGSMEGNKIHKAGGILMNRLKSVIKGDAQIYARFFDTDLYEEHKATNADEAKALVDMFNKENFSGGGTDIAGCLTMANKRIEELLDNNELLTRPELVVITDGESDIRSLIPRNFHPTKVHAFVVEYSNQSLVKFARDTGGVGIDRL